MKRIFIRSHDGQKTRLDDFSRLQLLFICLRIKIIINSFTNVELTIKDEDDEYVNSSIYTMYDNLEFQTL